jgi:hypothetical protein
MDGDVRPHKDLATQGDSRLKEGVSVHRRTRHLIVCLTARFPSEHRPRLDVVELIEAESQLGFQFSITPNCGTDLFDLRFPRDLRATRKPADLADHSEVGVFGGSLWLRLGRSMALAESVGSLKRPFLRASRASYRCAAGEVMPLRPISMMFRRIAGP